MSLAYPFVGRELVSLFATGRYIMAQKFSAYDIPLFFFVEGVLGSFIVLIVCLLYHLIRKKPITFGKNERWRTLFACLFSHLTAHLVPLTFNLTGINLTLSWVNTAYFVTAVVLSILFFMNVDMIIIDHILPLGVALVLNLALSIGDLTPNVAHMAKAVIYTMIAGSMTAAFDAVIYTFSRTVCFTNLLIAHSIIRIILSLFVMQLLPPLGNSIERLYSATQETAISACIGAVLYAAEQLTSAMYISNYNCLSYSLSKLSQCFYFGGTQYYSETTTMDKMYLGYAFGRCYMLLSILYITVIARVTRVGYSNGN